MGPALSICLLALYVVGFPRTLSVTVRCHPRLTRRYWAYRHDSARTTRNSMRSAPLIRSQGRSLMILPTSVPTSQKLRSRNWSKLVPRSSILHHPMCPVLSRTLQPAGSTATVASEVISRTMTESYMGLPSRAQLPRRIHRFGPVRLTFRARTQSGRFPRNRPNRCVSEQTCGTRSILRIGMRRVPT
jgi:hypothetical protein